MCMCITLLFLLVPPVNGVWLPWQRWSACDAHCGSGLRTRTRACQPPQHGGQPCAGSSLEYAVCESRVPCPGRHVHICVYAYVCACMSAYVQACGWVCVHEYSILLLWYIGVCCPRECLLWIYFLAASVHVGCFSQQPWTNTPPISIAYMYPNLRTDSRCLHRCREHRKNYAITRAGVECWCANAYDFSSEAPCNRDNFHVYKGLTGSKILRDVLYSCIPNIVFLAIVWCPLAAVCMYRYMHMYALILYAALSVLSLKLPIHVQFTACMSPCWIIAVFVL